MVSPLKDQKAKNPKKIVARLREAPQVKIVEGFFAVVGDGAKLPPYLRINCYRSADLHQRDSWVGIVVLLRTEKEGSWV